MGLESPPQSHTCRDCILNSGALGALTHGGSWLDRGQQPTALSSSRTTRSGAEFWQMPRTRWKRSRQMAGDGQEDKVFMMEEYSHYPTDVYAMLKMLEEQDTVSALKDCILYPDAIGTNTNCRK